jgi:hypothetical protein
MDVRFAVNLTHNGKEICFYVGHDNNNVNKLCVTVHAKYGSTVFYLCRENAGEWKLSSQHVPYWVKEILPLLTSQLEQKYFGQGYRARSNYGES